MITYNEAIEIVLSKSRSYGSINLPLKQSLGYLLDENIFTDRAFPPFDRSTKDGIAIAFSAIEKGINTFKLSTEIAAAGAPKLKLVDESYAIETMTGAVVPDGADTIIMYEHIEINDGIARIKMPVKKFQNIHKKASDQKAGEKVLAIGSLIGPPEIGVLATLGEDKPKLKKLPTVAIISTGNELVAIDQKPEDFQIRRSNVYSLASVLESLNINAELFHLPDEPEIIEKRILEVLEGFDVLIFSGGVSKGRYDYLPVIFNKIGVQKHFHKVKQRPGKPFWFGEHVDSNTMIFALPGNPVSSFICLYIYFIPWLNKSIGKKDVIQCAKLKTKVNSNPNLDLFRLVKTEISDGNLIAEYVPNNGSGDLLSLVESNGFVHVPAGCDFLEGVIVRVFEF